MTHLCWWVRALESISNTAVESELSCATQPGVHHYAFHPGKMEQVLFMFTLKVTES